MPNASTEELLERVRDGALLEAGQRVVVCLSGGRDSVCLLDLAVEICGRSNVSALHVNYGLRDEASDDEQLCRDLCQALGVQLTVENASAPREGNVQAWARDVRYGLGAQLASVLAASANIQARFSVSIEVSAQVSASAGAQQR